MGNHLATYWAVALALAVSFAASAVADEIEFEVVPAEHAVNAMALTEDGDHLVLAHKDENKLSVWDVATGKHVQDVEIDEPHFLIGRRQYMFVLDSSKGVVTPLSKSRDYRASRPIPVGIAHPYYMSAPGGRFYKGQILITGGGYGSRHVARLDVLRHSAEKIFDTTYMSIATVDYMGKSVLIQGEFNHSPPGSGIYDYSDFANAKDRKKISKGKPARGFYSWIHNTRPNEFWLSHNEVLSANDLSRENGGDAVIGDESTELFYLIKKDKLSAHRFDSKFTETGSRTISKFPNHQNYRGMGGRRGHQFIRPLAITDKGRLRIFTHDERGGKVYRASTESFPLRPERGGSGKDDPANQEAPPKIDDLSALTRIKPKATAPDAIQKQYSAAVVYVKIGGGFHRGMVVGPRGYVLTRASAISEASIMPTVNYSIAIGDREIAMNGRGRIVHIDAAADMALLKVDATAELPTIPLAFEPELEAGAAVHFVGTTDGKPIELKLNDIAKRVQAKSFITVAPAQPQQLGGGPLFDENGQVIGMILHRDGPADHTLVIPVDRLRAFLAEATKKEESEEQPDQ